MIRACVSSTVWYEYTGWEISKTLTEDLVIKWVKDYVNIYNIQRNDGQIKVLLLFCLRHADFKTWLDLKTGSRNMMSGNLLGSLSMYCVRSCAKFVTKCDFLVATWKLSSQNILDITKLYKFQKHSNLLCFYWSETSLQRNVF